MLSEYRQIFDPCRQTIPVFQSTVFLFIWLGLGVTVSILLFLAEHVLNQAECHAHAFKGRVVRKQEGGERGGDGSEKKKLFFSRFA